METRQLGVGFFLLAALASACSDDKKPPVDNPVDSGSTQDTGAPIDDAGPDAPPGDTRPCEGSTIKTGVVPLSFMGTDFTYMVHVPPGYDGTKRTPLVVNWHGAGSVGTEQEVFSAYDARADKEGFIVVYPTSPDKRWRAGLCCQPGPDGGGSAPVFPDAGDVRDDVGFARALVADISKNACIDSKRVYATGMSNGGFMAHRLACEAADIFAAVAPVAGKMAIPTCTPSRPIPIIDFHGTADMTIPYDSLWSSEGVDVPTMMSNWAMRNGCTGGPETTYQMGNSTCKTWSQCNGGVLVTFCSQDGDGHCWPGASFCPGPDGGMPYSKDISATRDGWAFLQKFVLP